MSANNGNWANPAAAGLLVLGFYLACLWPCAVGMAPHELIYILIPLGFVGGLVQFVAGLIELRSGAVLPGNVFLAFCGFMWLGFWEKLLQALHILPHNTAAVDGWVFLVMAIVMVGVTPGYFLASTAASVFMVFTDIFFLSAAFYFLTGAPVLWKIAGWSLPFVILCTVWQALAIMLNPVFGREVVPLGSPWLKRS